MSRTYLYVQVVEPIQQVTHSQGICGFVEHTHLEQSCRRGAWESMSISIMHSCEQIHTDSVAIKYLAVIYQITLPETFNEMSVQFCEFSKSSTPWFEIRSQGNYKLASQMQRSLMMG